MPDPFFLAIIANCWYWQKSCSSSPKPCYLSNPFVMSPSTDTVFSSFPGRYQLKNPPKVHFSNLFLIDKTELIQISWLFFFLFLSHVFMIFWFSWLFYWLPVLFSLHKYRQNRISNMFINRYDEINSLKSLLDLDKASIAVCKGRRRIGKSRLIEEFGRHAANFINIQGLAPRKGIKKQDQLAAFGSQLSKNTTLPPLIPDFMGAGIQSPQFCYW